MEKSKLISSLIAKLKIAYPYYFDKIDDELLLGLVSLYQDNLSNYSEEILNKAVNSIIIKSKFMPSVADIIESCEKQELNQKLEIIEKMIVDGYFKDPTEIEKANRWIEKKNIPSWFKKDMKKYENITLEKCCEMFEKEKKAYICDGDSKKIIEEKIGVIKDGS